jgi:hypothetical protein
MCYKLARQYYNFSFKQPYIFEEVKKEKKGEKEEKELTYVFIISGIFLSLLDFLIQIF